MIQENFDGGLDQDGSSGGGKKLLDVEYVLKIEYDWLMDWFWYMREVVELKRFRSLSKWKYEDVIS